MAALATIHGLAVRQCSCRELMVFALPSESLYGFSSLLGAAAAGVLLANKGKA